MNISRILRMVLQRDLSQEALSYLLRTHGECEHLDFKEIINFDIDHDCVTLVKDIVGMKNIGGGYIVIGVKDKTWYPIGIEKSFSIDSKILREKIVKYSGLDIDVDFVEHKLIINEKELQFAFILVRSSLKRGKLKSPSICKKSSSEKEKWGIRQGDIYIRDGDQTIRLDDFNKLTKKLEELEYSYQESQFDEQNSIPSPFEVEEGFYRLLPREYENFVGRTELLVKVKNAVEKDPRLWIINIYGPGGVGKSALATRVAYDYFQNKKFESIIHLSAKDQELSSKDGIKALKPSLISIEDFLDKILCLFSHNEYCSKELQEKKDCVNQILSAWKTLIILDNMETVRDARIMDFIRDLPQDTKTKVLLTSRRRTGEWEYPIPVPEMSFNEIAEFLEIRTKELGIDFPFKDTQIVKKVEKISGGLPLAIQWILGEYSKTKNLKSILERVITPESPLLEFSFRNSWGALDSDSKTALAVLSVFNESPTIYEWRSVINWPIDRIEKSIAQLIESTFISQRTDKNTGKTVYIALPITLSFAQNELVKNPDLYALVKNRYQEFRESIELSEKNISQFEGLFKSFNARNDNQKRAITLARMAEGQLSSFGYDEAEEYYKQALSIDPLNIYALVSYGRFKSELMEYKSAISLIEKALSKRTKETSFYIFYNLADVYSRMREYAKKVNYLQMAISLGDPNDRLFRMAQHSLGVALGRCNRHAEAIDIFKKIIEQELIAERGPSSTLVVAVRTMKISMRKIGKMKESEEIIDEIIKNIKSIKNNENLIDELNHIKYNE